MNDLCGVIYIIFGANARAAADASIASLRRVNPDMPIFITGDEHVYTIPGTVKRSAVTRWDGENPYDARQIEQFHFLAGRVKPFLYDYSPFGKTLYVDADTEFQQDPAPGFALLDRYDFMLAKHSSHNVGMLNQKPGDERITTINEIGGDGDTPYPNSGVLFWKKSAPAKTLFQSWYTEWMRFQEWDEQLALMRAYYKNPLRMLLLPEAWNGENKKEGSIIFHDFHGQRIARTNYEPEKQTA